MSRFTGEYPSNWKALARAIKDKHDWKCIRCGTPHSSTRGCVLTVHHLDNDKGNCRWWNLVALCQRCHLQIQGKVIMQRPWILPHSLWFRPYCGGFFAFKYLGLDLTYDEVMADLDFYASLEMTILGEIQK